MLARAFRVRGGALAVAIALFAAMGRSFGSDFEINDITFTREGAPRITFSSDTDSYYALYRIDLQSGTWVPGMSIRSSP